MTEQVTWEVLICPYGTDDWQRAGFLDEMPNQFDAEKYVFEFIAKTLGFWEDARGFKIKVMRVNTQKEEVYQDDISATAIKKGINDYLDEIMN